MVLYSNDDRFIFLFIDSVAQDWVVKNPWFGKNREMTEYALEVHEDLILSKKTQVGSAQYYDQLDETMRTDFELF